MIRWGISCIWHLLHGKESSNAKVDLGLGERILECRVENVVHEGRRMQRAFFMQGAECREAKLKKKNVGENINLESLVRLVNHV